MKNQMSSKQTIAELFEALHVDSVTTMQKEKLIAHWVVCTRITLVFTNQNVLQCLLVDMSLGNEHSICLYLVNVRL